MSFDIDLGCAQALETLQVDTAATKFTKMTPAAFISAMTSSGGSESDCRDFATETQTEISTTVTSTQATHNAIDNGDGCAQEGQTEVSTARDRLDNAQTSLTAAQADVVTKEDAKHVACTAGVNLGTMGLNALEMETCFDYTNLADYTTIKAACTSATSALTAANQVVVTAQAELTEAQTAHATFVAEASRLMNACHCRVHHEQNAVWASASTTTASHAADWKQVHEIVCALDKTTTCQYDACPTVTKPIVAAGVDAEDCSVTVKKPNYLVNYGGHGKLDADGDVVPMQTCEGDCDQDSDCAGNLQCFERDAGGDVPGCGNDVPDPSLQPSGYNPSRGYDFCYNPDQ